ncbi:MAG: hypothetical protein KJO40_13695 [Deltaproteobacteria bacterium]|nr:hypothetical protein [Deltaproteobacteria bacterium]
MALQRDTASNRVQRSQDHWRLFQQIESSGDIFEIDESLKGVAIGPDSDVAEVLLSYYDPAQPQAVEQLSVAVGNPFEGRIDALMGTEYPQTQSPARILASLGDLIDNAYVPHAWWPGDPEAEPPEAPDTITYATTFVDLIGYFDKKAEQARVRSDRKILFSRYSGMPSGAQAAWYVVPAYGRRYCRALFVNNVATAPTPYSVDIDLIGVRLGQGLNSSGGNSSGEVLIGSQAGITGITGSNVTGSSGQVIYRSSLHGLFDLLVLKTVPSLPIAIFGTDANIRFDLSDTEEG